MAQTCDAEVHVGEVSDHSLCSGPHACVTMEVNPVLSRGRVLWK